MRPPYRARNSSATGGIDRGTAMANSRPSRVMPRPGGLCDKLPRTLAIHLGLRRIAKPQFDAGADLVLQRRP